MKEPEIWGDAKFTRKSPFMGICVRPGWTARASQLSKGWVPLCADFMGKAGQKVPFHYPFRKQTIFNLSYFSDPVYSAET